jgi:hypothetical protein
MNDIKLAIFATVGPVLLLAILSYYLFAWKTKKKRGNDELTNKLPEILLGSSYFVIAIFLYIFSNHYFNIEFNKKNILKTEANKEVDEFSKLLIEYKKKVNDKLSKLETDVNLNTTYLFSGNPTFNSIGKNGLNLLIEYSEKDLPTIKQRLETKKTILRDKIYGTDSISTAMSKYTNDLKSTFINWQITQVKYKYENMDEEFSKYYQILHRKMPEFNIANSSTEFNFPTLTTSFTDGSILIIILGFSIYIILHICILGKYFKAERQVKLIVDNNQKGTTISGDWSKF